MSALIAAAVIAVGATNCKCKHLTLGLHLCTRILDQCVLTTGAVQLILHLTGYGAHTACLLLTICGAVLVTGNRCM